MTRPQFRPQMVMLNGSASIGTSACSLPRPHSKTRGLSPAWWCQTPTSWSIPSLLLFTVSLTTILNLLPHLIIHQGSLNFIFVKKQKKNKNQSELFVKVWHNNIYNLFATLIHVKSMVIHVIPFQCHLCIKSLTESLVFLCLHSQTTQTHLAR